MKIWTNESRILTIQTNESAPLYLEGLTNKRLSSVGVPGIDVDLGLGVVEVVQVLGDEDEEAVSDSPDDGLELLARVRPGPHQPLSLHIEGVPNPTDSLFVELCVLEEGFIIIILPLFVKEYTLYSTRTPWAFWHQRPLSDSRAWPTVARRVRSRGPTLTPISWLGLQVSIVISF